MLRPREIAHVLVWVGRHMFGRMPVPATDLLRTLVKPTDILMDIGAHSGNWTVALAELVPEGKVYAFEALPYYARVLTATIRILRTTNVEIVPMPLLDERRSVEIVWRDRPGRRLTGRTHVRGTDESASDTIRTQGTTLDSMLSDLEGSVRFLKMDIEGAELLALKGGKRLIEIHRPLLRAEVNEEYCSRYGHTAADVFDFLLKRDYRGYLYSDGAWGFVDAQSYVGYGDVWFVPSEEVARFVGNKAVIRQSAVENDRGIEPG